MYRFRLLAVLVLTLALAACGTAPQTPPQATEVPAAPQATAAAPAAPQATEVAPAAATAAPPATETPATGGSVSRALTTEPPTLDPAGAQGSGQNILLPYLFDTLVIQDGTNTLQPLLAETWEIAPDGASIDFTLKEGLVFHDGTPLDADAVVFSFERLRDPANKSPMAASLKIVTSIEATDERTVRFSLAQPSATFFSTLTSPYAGIVSPAAVQASGADFAQKPVGSGPFKLAEWQPGVAITLERNPDYSWGPPSVKNKGAPYIDTAVFKVIPDAATQLSALQAGEVDIIFLNQPDHITRLAGEASIQLIPVSLNSLAYLGFNCQKPPFDDVKVRQAFSHAIDKDAIVQTAVGGQGTPAFAPMATTLLGFSDSLKELELGYDPEKAKALLAEAGFSQGADGAWAKDGQPLQVTLLTFTRAPNQDVATVIQSQLKEIGVPATIEQFDSPTASKAATEGKYDLLLWRYDWNDPDVLNVNLSSTRIGSTNRVFYSNPTVDELLGKASGEFDNEARARLYLEAQRAIMADAPWQPLYTPVDMLAVTGRVQGIVISSMGRVLLNDVTIAE